MRIARRPTNKFKEGQIGFKRIQVKIKKKIRRKYFCVSYLSTMILFLIYFHKYFLSTTVKNGVSLGWSSKKQFFKQKKTTNQPKKQEKSIPHPPLHDEQKHKLFQCAGRIGNLVRDQLALTKGSI